MAIHCGGNDAGSAVGRTPVGGGEFLSNHGASANLVRQPRKDRKADLFHFSPHPSIERFVPPAAAVWAIDGERPALLVAT